MLCADVFEVCGTGAEQAWASIPSAPMTPESSCRAAGHGRGFHVRHPLKWRVHLLDGGEVPAALTLCRTETGAKRTRAYNGLRRLLGSRPTTALVGRVPIDSPKSL